MAHANMICRPKSEARVIVMLKNGHEFISTFIRQENGVIYFKVGIPWKISEIESMEYVKE